ncbi:MAG: dockerin type I repeat-containing protein, partial [Oscillospiraceae bacterium]|nr:dockerin type I repeat-containing protein [Oscillospiraceae bacterium]
PVVNWKNEQDKVTAGRKNITGQVQNILFDGITFSHTDWLLQKVGDSRGKASVQSCGITYTAYATNNWHFDMYRNLDLMPAAVTASHARNIHIRNGAVTLTGALGISLVNDVTDCSVTGNVIRQTGGGGVTVGHPQHVFENDSLEPDVYVHHVDQDKNKPVYGAAADKEKFQNGTEAVPRSITVANNLLWECSRLFKADTAFTSFFTDNLRVEHNHIRDTGYSGMTVGWGWCNFDGKPSSFTGWGTGNLQPATLPDHITTVARNNKIIGNRIENTMTTLHDGGAIYTLGSQPGTHMRYNFVNGTDIGLYTDEGSAYFGPIDNNVVKNTGQSLYAGDYGRKHDLFFSNTYSNLNQYNINTLPSANIKVAGFRYIGNARWPKEAFDTVTGSGLEKTYAKKYLDKLITIYGSVQDVLLPESAQAYANERLAIKGVLEPSDEIWLAPAGTTAFAEGDTMTKMTGDGDAIRVPAASGTYRLFVRSGGDVSDVSKCAVYVSSEPSVQAVADNITVTAPVSNDTVLKMPYVPDGFSIAMKSSSDPDVIDLNGVITPPEWDVILTLVYTVTKNGVSADTAPITVRVPALSEEESVPPPQIKIGDVNGNGVIDIGDARMVLQYIVGKITLDKRQLDAANVSGNGQLSVSDARLILQFLVHKITAFPRKV